ncbi:hypothetical protein M1O12_00410 [Dehalococcoidia bacterium]|nr:hypothetical protein [Dehalococcoidia bacterium]
MNTLVPQQVWIPAPPPVRLPPPDVWIPVIPERPQIQAWTPLGWVPLGTGPTFPPGTRIKIEVPITNNSNESFSTRIRVGIFEGSILPGRGDRIATIDSSWQTLTVGQTRDFSVTHTTRLREGVERRDVNIEVQYLDAGRVTSGGDREWDDLFWVKEKIEFVIGEPTVTAA